MDFRHLIVTCLFSKLRLPFDNQKVKENYTILFHKIYGFDNVSVVDSSMNFYKTHNLNPILGKDVVFLLDSTNIILAIGNPIENLKID